MKPKNKLNVDSLLELEQHIKNMKNIDNVELLKHINREGYISGYCDGWRLDIEYFKNKYK